MMSSAIPARLLFQCGHAALVTLPRVKGESAAQRNERVAREKNNALTRQCDFCGPTVDVAIHTNGNHLDVADILAAEPVVVAEQTMRLNGERATEPDRTDEEEPVVIVVEEPAAIVEEPFVTLEAAEEVEEVEEPTLIIEETVVEEPVVVVLEVAKQGRRAARKPRAPISRPVTIRRRYAVEYRQERVLHAVDMRDAFRQAASLGAKEILAIESA